MAKVCSLLVQSTPIDISGKLGKFHLQHTRSHVLRLANPVDIGNRGSCWLPPHVTPDPVPHVEILINSLNNSMIFDYNRHSRHPPVFSSQFNANSAFT